MSERKKTNLSNLTPDEVTKYEIAAELGLLDRVLEDGWKSLTAKETGRIGGLVTRRKREQSVRMQEEQQEIPEGRTAAAAEKAVKASEGAGH